METMKETYLKPAITVLDVEPSEIICVSGTFGSDYNGNDTDTPDYGDEGDGEDY